MRKHKEVIEAWLSGKDIQFKSHRGDKWQDYSENYISNPMYSPDLQWRIKPKETKEEIHCISIPISTRALKDFTGFNICYDKNEIQFYFK